MHAVAHFWASGPLAVCTAEYLRVMRCIYVVDLLIDCTQAGLLIDWCTQAGTMRQSTWPAPVALICKLYCTVLHGPSHIFLLSVSYLCCSSCHPCASLVRIIAGLASCRGYSFVEPKRDKFWRRGKTRVEVVCGLWSRGRVVDAEVGLKSCVGFGRGAVLHLL